MHSKSCHDSTCQSISICIIGAGAFGLAALKTVLDTIHYVEGTWKPTVFEARNDIGGIWLPSPPDDNPPLTPLYDSLTTNLPHPVMAYPDFPFPPSTPLFPSAYIVKQYLDSYADHYCLRPHIKLRTTVEDVSWNGSLWQVRLSTGEVSTFDLVLVCNGHYQKPRYPDTPGLALWLESGKATHSAWYRTPDRFGENDIVLVLGSGPSANDISKAVHKVSRTVIRSMTRKDSKHQDSVNMKYKGLITRFEENGQVIFEDNTVESNITHCILATGYEYSFPFLSEKILRMDMPAHVPPLPESLYNSTHSIFPLARHIFPLQATFPPHTLALLGLPTKILPFPLAEAQARVVLHTFANPGVLDLDQESADLVAKYGELGSQFNSDSLSISQAWHKFTPALDFDYRDNLYDLINSSHPDTDTTFRNTNGNMKVQDWVKKFRCKGPALRAAWVELEKKGEAEEWICGVGERGPDEWIHFMEKVLAWAEENDLDVEGN